MKTVRVRFIRQFLYDGIVRRPGEVCDVEVEDNGKNYALILQSAGFVEPVDKSESSRREYKRRDMRPEK